MMGGHTFAFNNVLTVDKVDDFFERLESLYIRTLFEVIVDEQHPDVKYTDVIQYVDCYVEQRDQTIAELNPNYPKLRNVVGRIQFASKHTLTDVKLLLLCALGKSLCAHLFVVPSRNVKKIHGGFVNEKEPRVCQRMVLGKLKRRK